MELLEQYINFEQNPINLQELIKLHFALYELDVVEEAIKSYLEIPIGKKGYSLFGRYTVWDAFCAFYPSHLHPIEGMVEAIKGYTLKSEIVAKLGGSRITCNKAIPVYLMYKYGMNVHSLDRKIYHHYFTNLDPETRIECIEICKKFDISIHEFLSELLSCQSVTQFTRSMYKEIENFLCDWGKSDIKRMLSYRKDIL